MTRDDIIRMAKKAGFSQILETNTGADVWIDDGFYIEKLTRFAVLIAAAEREACAKLADEFYREGMDYDIGASIRARK